MTQFVIANNVNTQLATAASSSATTLTLASSVNLPTLSAGQIMPLTLNDAATGLVYEVVYVTAISGVTLTVTRAQEGTGAQNWNIGDYAFCAPTAGTVATSLGNPNNTFQVAPATASNQAIQAGQALGLFLGVQTFTSSGTYTPGTYTVGGRSVTATKAWVRAIGAGGAGGGSQAAGSSTVSLGSGGGAGAYGELLVTSGLSSQTVTIGAGGTGVSGANGNAGGATSFGSLMSCAGGIGGLSSGSAISPPIIIIGGSASVPRVTGSGTILVNGAGHQGSMGVAVGTTTYASGQGATSQWGQGGQQAIAAGNSGNGYGSGGGGSLSALSGAAAAGGTGAPGLMLVFEYA